MPEGDAGIFDVAIVGSGPAGLSAAAHAATKGMRHVLLEKTDHLSDTIFKYQKGKHVMATPSHLVLRADLDFDAGKREAILETWNRQIAEGKVEVMLDAEVSAIEGAAGDFKLTLKRGATVRAKAVVMAIGTQGNPNLVRCPVGEGAVVQYQLDDPAEYVDEHIVVIGAGDAGIENAMGLAADPTQGNKVTIVNRSRDFATAKAANVQALLAMQSEGKITVMLETTTSAIDKGEITFDTRDGELKARCDRVIARMGSAPPRAFVEAACAEFEEREGKRAIKVGTGIEFSSPDRVAYPKLSPTFESTVPGIYVIGALAGYPLIKHCMNQGYDVIEFLSGNTSLKPADEPILEQKFADLPGGRPVDEWLALFGRNVIILQELSALQLRELMLDSTARYFEQGEVIFTRNDPGSSMFAIAQGSVAVEVNPDDTSITVPIGEGSIFGEVGLISGRRRGATIRAAEPTIALEFSRNAALKLLATAPSAARAVNRISIERQLLQMFGSGLTSEDLTEITEAAVVEDKRAGEVVISEGGDDKDVFVIRRGSMVVEKAIGGHPVFLSYLPAGSYFGEMAVIDGSKRSATVKAAVKSQVVRFPGEAFAALLERKPRLREKALADMAGRRKLNAFVESRKDSFGDAADYHSQTAKFLVDNGIGEATDVLLIDETLCVGCDNCEKACADSHDGLSRLDREAGRTYAHLHVPTSCRHCEHPHCMADCPPNAIKRGPDGEVFIDETCIGCGNCQRNCPYGVIRMDAKPPKKPGLLSWMFLGLGPGPGEASYAWRKKKAESAGKEVPKVAIKCDMCSGIDGGPACVRACPTGAAIRVGPEKFLAVSQAEKAG
ncbi:cyclic nucleotide-binding domain-containing protein [Tsuneonella sp. HG249]